MIPRQHFSVRPIFQLLAKLFAASAILAAAACTNTGLEPPGDSIPLWARQFPRTVEHGYIIFMESDDDPSLERAKFKAENSALADLVNECSLPPKGVRVEDRYEHKVGHLYQAYAKIAIEAQLCDKAQKSDSAEAIHALGNQEMAKQLLRFEEDAGETPDIVLAADASGPALGKEGESSVPPTPPGKVLVRDDEHFYTVRERLALNKLYVLKSDAQPDSDTVARSEAIQKYTTDHPQLKDANKAWAFYRHILLRPRIDSGQDMRQVGIRPSPTPPGGVKVEPHRRRNIQIDPNSTN